MIDLETIEVGQVVRFTGYILKPRAGRTPTLTIGEGYVVERISHGSKVWVRNNNGVVVDYRPECFELVPGLRAQRTLRVPPAPAVPPTQKPQEPPVLPRGATTATATEGADAGII